MLCCVQLAMHWAEAEAMQSPKTNAMARNENMSDPSIRKSPFEKPSRRICASFQVGFAVDS
jgi:hypothetical protein